MDRRGFLERALGLSAATATLSCAQESESDAEARPVAQRDPSTRARVAVSRDPEVRVEGERFAAQRVGRMLDAALVALTNANDAPSAWKSLFSPKDVVGVKVNCLAGRRLSTHPVVAQAVVRGLLSAGVPESAIYVWERSSRELIRAGFAINESKTGPRCVGVNGRYDSEITQSGEVGSCWAPLVSSVCTAHINAPVLKDHLLAGLGVGMKNFFGAIHNPNKYHDNHCDPYVADVSNCPLIRDRLRLVACDALNGQYDGGPTLRPDRLWEENALLLATDPVALDTVAGQIIDRRRVEAGLKTVAESGRAPTWLETAHGYGLGENDPERIEVVDASF
jgi:uncharacterized protein (DUF362 family)